MQLQFMDGNISEGIIEGIMEAGKALGDHFPRRDDDVNELPDDIVFGKGDI